MNTCVKPREALSKLTAKNFPEISNETLRDSITELAACITVATAHLLKLIAELDRRQAWGDWGLKSCAHWLNWQCGIDLGAAREKVRVARALEALPLISDAFGNGEVSYSKVRAMTRVANASNEEYLLMIARHGTAAHMEDLVRGYRRVQRNQALENANKAHAERSLSWHWDEDGALVIRARLPAEAGAVVLKALTAATDELNTEDYKQDVSAETCIGDEVDAGQPTASAKRADSLAHVCEDYLASPTQPHRSADRYQVMIDVKHPVISDEALAARIQDGPCISESTVERLCCDSSVIAIKTAGDGEVLDVGRKQRTVPTALRRALAHRDNGCRFPGCTTKRHVDAHHIQHWSKGGHTKLDNLVLLCRHHHRLVHEGGYQVVFHERGRLDFLTPQGAKIPTAIQTTQPTANVHQMVAQSGKHVSAETLIPQWAGERMDLGMAVDGLISRADRHRSI